MIKDIKYIITDLDGTIAIKNFIITPKTIKIINNFQKKSNNKLIIATGRSDFMLKKYIEKLNIKMPIISCNGALIRDPNNNEILQKFTIENEIALKIIKKLLKNDLNVVIYTSNTIYSEDNNPRIESIKKYNKNQKIERYKINYKIVENIIDCINNEISILKILITLNKNEEKIIIKKIIDKYSNNELTFSTSQSNIIDITNKNANKGKGLKYICKKYNIKNNEIIAYGDNENDYEMLKEAGYAVVVKNSIPNLKTIANEIIDYAEKDSVAKHIEKNFL